MSNSKIETTVGGLVLVLAIGFFIYVLNSTNVMNRDDGLNLKASFPTWTILEINLISISFTFQ